MIIDWYTIIFQIINFMILVFLLRYFLYGPIIRVMDEREESIMQREEDAETVKSEAEEEKRAYLAKSEELQQQEEKIREKAREDAEKEKRELLEKARREVDDTRHRWEEAFTREKETFIFELRRRIGTQACSIARRCLEDLADARLEKLTWNLFLEKLINLPDQELKQLSKALGSDSFTLSLRSAFDLTDAQLKELEKGLKKMLPDLDGELKISAKLDADLICGLELASGGYRVAWNIESYLEGVEEQVLKELDQQLPAEKEEEVAGGDKTGD